MLLYTLCKCDENSDSGPIIYVNSNKQEFKSYLTNYILSDEYENGLKRFSTFWADYLEFNLYSKDINHIIENQPFDHIRVYLV